MSQNEIPFEDENENEIEIENGNEDENENENEIEDEIDNDELIPISSPQPCDNQIGVSMPVVKKMARKRRRKELKAIREIDFASSSSDAEAFPSLKIRRRFPLWRGNCNTTAKSPPTALAQISSSSSLSEDIDDSKTKTKTSKQLEKICFLLGKKAKQSPYAWLGKEVIYEMDKIKDERIKRKASWAIQEVLKESIVEDLALRNGFIRSSRLPNIPSTSSNNPPE